MAFPLAPIAIHAVRIGAVMALTYYVANKNKSLPKTSEEAAHEDVDEGLSVRHHRGDGGSQANADARFKRTIRLGSNGPGFEVDASALGRIRFKRL